MSIAAEAMSEGSIAAQEAASPKPPRRRQLVARTDAVAQPEAR